MKEVAKVVGIIWLSMNGFSLEFGMLKGLLEKTGDGPVRRVEVILPGYRAGLWLARPVRGEK